MPVTPANSRPAAPGRPLPLPTPETSHFWEGTRAGRLLLQRCTDCASIYFPPRPFCPTCGHREVEVIESSGRATLYSYVINQRPGAGFDGPTALAVVELEEGPRMMTNIVDVEQTEEALVLDMDLEVTYLECSDEIWLPVFRPATATEGGLA